MPELPAWVYDLIINLQDHEEHPKLVYTSGAFEGTADYDWCPCNALALVPDDVREKAEAIQAYMLQKVAALPPEGE